MVATLTRRNAPAVLARAAMAHHVVHILGTGRVEGAATARIVVSLAREMDPDKFVLHTRFLDGDGPLSDELRDAGVRVRALQWSRSAGDPKGALAFAASLRGEHFSIVHQHIGGRMVSWLARGATGAALIYHLHTRVFEARGLEPAPLTVPSAAAVIAVSDAVAQRVTNARPRVVHVGVPMVETGVKRAVGAPAVGEVIGVACRLVPVKGLIYLVRALAMLREEFPDLRLEIAGAGPQQGVIEAEARSLGLAESVVFLGWRRDLLKLMQGWDVFALPSLDEGCPLGVLEAMASGLPVVASNVGGLPELVQDGRTGYLVAPGDPAAIAGRLRMLLCDRQSRCAMGAASRKRVRECFSARAMAQAIAQIYEDVLASADRR